MKKFLGVYLKDYGAGLVMIAFCTLVFFALYGI